MIFTVDCGRFNYKLPWPKKYEKTAHTWRRRVISRACMRLCSACAPISIILARVVGGTSDLYTVIPVDNKHFESVAWPVMITGSTKYIVTTADTCRFSPQSSRKNFDVGSSPTKIFITRDHGLTLYVPIIAILDIWKTTLFYIRRVRRIQVCMARKG